jgi:hypothetical protein
VVRGIPGGSEEHVDLTHNPYLKITSSDETIVAVDREHAIDRQDLGGRGDPRILQRMHELDRGDSARTDHRDRPVKIRCYFRKPF